MRDGRGRLLDLAGLGGRAGSGFQSAIRRLEAASIMSSPQEASSWAFLPAAALFQLVENQNLNIVSSGAVSAPGRQDHRQHGRSIRLARLEGRRPLASWGV